jgi:hypothetical protein
MIIFAQQLSQQVKSLDATARMLPASVVAFTRAGFSAWLGYYYFFTNTFFTNTQGA